MRTLALSLMFLAAPLVACGGPPTPVDVTTNGVRLVDVGTFATDKDAGRYAVVVDVRTPEEFADGHVPGAVNVPLDQLGAKLDTLAPRDAEVAVICRSGSRSAAASRKLASAGYTKVTDVDGGTLAWISAGKPVE